MAAGYLLSEADYAIFKEMALLHRSRNVNQQRRPRIDPDDFVNAPELYVVRNDLALPAASYGTGTGTFNDFDSYLGTGQAEVQQLLDFGTGVQPRATGVYKLINNLTGKQIPAESLFAAARDKYGHWIAMWPGVMSACPLLSSCRVTASINIEGQTIATDVDTAIVFGEPPIVQNQDPRKWTTGGYLASSLGNVLTAPYDGEYHVAGGLVMEVPNGDAFNWSISLQYNWPSGSASGAIAEVRGRRTSEPGLGGVVDLADVLSCRVRMRAGDTMALVFSHSNPSPMAVLTSESTFLELAMIAPLFCLEGPTGIRNLYSGVCVDSPTDCCPGMDHPFVGTGTVHQGTGTGSVTGTGGGGSGCCPGVTIPSTLHVTIANVSGCACLAGTYTLTAFEDTWDFFGTVCGISIQMTLACAGVPTASWIFSIDWDGGASENALGVVSCNPLDLTATFPISGTGAPCTGAVNITVTP